MKFFRIFGDDRYGLESLEGVRPSGPAAKVARTGGLPEEIIDEAHKDHLHLLRQQLKEKILQNHPAFFERLVIELLLRMGYGGSDPALGIHTGGPGDGGIDGIIKEDKLGLEQIYIQAKRYALEREVKRTEVQRFQSEDLLGFSTRHGRDNNGSHVVPEPRLLSSSGAS